MKTNEKNYFTLENDDVEEQKKTTAKTASNDKTMRKRNNV